MNSILEFHSLDSQKSAVKKSPAFDSRDLRTALGQFATGVAIVTARNKRGRCIGLTVNSFASVSLNPPLILWSLGKSSNEYSDFAKTRHFAINVLGAGQHHLSRRFSEQVEDRFAELDCSDSIEGCPLLNGATAHFVCRIVRKFQGGDHVIFLGEVIHYRYRVGEPLIFHSGQYHVKTRHPNLPDE
jgi:flavin reductase (DIM6/NTAB) family NADH-FMN oxidoreductase RutF